MGDFHLVNLHGKPTGEPAVKLGRVGAGTSQTAGMLTYEENTALRGSKKWELFERMENDPHVKRSLRETELPLRTARWEVKPAGDSPRDMEIAEFVGANLLRASGPKYGRAYWTQTSQAQRMTEIMRMMPDGFSLFHKTWRRVGTKKVYDRLKWLEPLSLAYNPWIFDGDDNLLGIRREYRNGAGDWITETINAKDTALYVWDLRGIRYEGRSFLRSMYGPWLRKEHLLRLAAIHAQKLGSPVPYGEFPNRTDPSDIADFEDFIQSLRGTSPEWAWGAFPKASDGEGYDVKFAGIEHDVNRTGDMVQIENAELAAAGGSKAGLLGETAQGARALGDSLLGLQMLLVQSVGTFICEYEEHGIGNLKGLVQELVDQNFANVEAYPTLNFSNFDPGEKDQQLDRITRATEKGLLPNHPEIKRRVAALTGLTDLPDDIFEPSDQPIAAELIQRAFIEAGALTINDLRRAVGLQEVEWGDEPAKVGQGIVPEVGNEDSPIAPVKSPRKAEPGVKPDDIAPVDADDDEAEGFEAARLEAAQEFQQRISHLLMPIESGKPPKGQRRYPTWLERDFCKLGSIRDGMGRTEGAVSGALKKSRRLMGDELLGRVGNGKITRRTIESQGRSRFRQRRKALAMVLDQAERAAEIGQQQAAEELESQIATIEKWDEPPAAMARLEVGDGAVAGNALSSEAAAAAVETIETVTEVSIDRIWNDLRSGFLQEYERLSRLNLDEDELLRRLEAWTEGLSPTPIDDAGRQLSTVAQNQGRGIVAQTAADADLAQYVVRSEILDSATCEVCVGLDSSVYEIGSPAYHEFMPPSGCLGGDRCRGFYVIVADGLAI